MEIRRSFYGWASNMAAQSLPDPWSSADAFEEVVGMYLEAGINEFIMDQPGPHQQAVLERVASETIPRLRATAADGQRTDHESSAKPQLFPGSNEHIA